MSEKLIIEDKNKVKCEHEYQTIPNGKYGVCIHCEKQVKMYILKKEANK